MKTKTKVSLLAAMLIVFTVSIQAQRGPGRGMGPGHGYGYGPDSCRTQIMVNDLAKELSLNEKQEAQILQIHYEHMAEMKALRNEYKNDCVGEREARYNSREKMDAEVKKVLNSDQLAAYDDFMTDRRGPHRGHGRHPRW